MERWNSASRKGTLIHGKMDAWKIIRWNRNPAIRKKILVNGKMDGNSIDGKESLQQPRKPDKWKTLGNSRWKETLIKRIWKETLHT
jgi:hypothetical protein